MKVLAKLFLVLVLNICVMSYFTYKDNGNMSLAETSTNNGIDLGQKAPTFKLSTVDGKEFDLESFRKDKFVLMIFGTTWCPYCVHEVPVLNEYYDEFKNDGLEVLNIDIQESKKKVRSFVEKKSVNYPVVLDSKADVARLYKVIGIPLSIVLDKNGIIKYRNNLSPSKEVLEKLLVN